MKEFTVGKHNISLVGSDFQEWFKDVSLGEGPKVLTSKALPRSMNDREILEELRPEEVTLGDVLHAIDSQLKKEDWCIFYVKDSYATLRAVHVNWYDGGWRVGAYSVESASRWREGCRVFSRNFGSKALSPSHSDSLSFELEKRVAELEASMKKIKQFLII